MTTNRPFFVPPDVQNIPFCGKTPETIQEIKKNSREMNIKNQFLKTRK
jgi:hypothetical protein